MPGQGLSQVTRLAACVSVAAALGASPWSWAATPAGSRTDKVRFKDDVGQTRLALKFKDDGAKLVDAQDQELARYTRSENRIKVKDTADKVLGYVVLTADLLRLEAADQRTELFSLRRQADGGWKLEDPQRARVYTLKPREYGVELEDAHSASLYKVKSKSGKTSLRNRADQTVYRTDEELSAPAMACLGFDQLADVRLRVALLFAMDCSVKK